MLERARIVVKKRWPIVLVLCVSALLSGVLLRSFSQAAAKTTRTEPATASGKVPEQLQSPSLPVATTAEELKELTYARALETLEAAGKAGIKFEQEIPSFDSLEQTVAYLRGRATHELRLKKSYDSMAAKIGASLASGEGKLAPASIKSLRARFDYAKSKSEYHFVLAAFFRSKLPPEDG